MKHLFNDGRKTIFTKSHYLDGGKGPLPKPEPKIPEPKPEPTIDEPVYRQHYPYSWNYSPPGIITRVYIKSKGDGTDETCTRITYS